MGHSSEDSSIRQYNRKRGCRKLTASPFFIIHYLSADYHRNLSADYHRRHLPPTVFSGFRQQAGCSSGGRLRCLRPPPVLHCPTTPIAGDSPFTDPNPQAPRPVPRHLLLNAPSSQPGAPSPQRSTPVTAAPRPSCGAVRKTSTPPSSAQPLYSSFRYRCDGIPS